MLWGMNRLSPEDRAKILTLLVEGNSLRATARIADISYNTVCKLFVDAGRACADFQDTALRDLPCKRLQLDEIWSFVYAKQRNVAGAKSAPDNSGDVWTWVAIDADTKLVAAWHIGDRTTWTACDFVADLASRLRNRVQITSDGHRPYVEAVDTVFGNEVDFAQLIKIYGEAGVKGPERKYSPGECCGTVKKAITGNPDIKAVSTSF